MAKIIAFDGTKGESLGKKDAVQSRPNPNRKILVEELYVNYAYDELTISALNFIMRYRGESITDLNERLTFATFYSLSLSNHLLEVGSLRTRDDEFDWIWGQDNRLTYPQRVKIYDPEFLNRFVETSEYNQHNIHSIINLAHMNCIQEFLDYMNGRDTSITFPGLKEVRLRAMEKGDGELVKIINQMELNPEHELNFSGVGEDPEKMIPELIKF